MTCNLRHPMSLRQAVSHICGISQTSTSHGTHMWNIYVKYQRAIAHICEISTSHGKHMRNINEPCYTYLKYQRAMPHLCEISTSHGTHMWNINEPWYTYLKYQRAMAKMCEASHSYVHIHAYVHITDREALLQRLTHHFIHHTCGWVMSRMDESCHMWMGHVKCGRVV